MGWEIVGWMGQGCYFSRFLIQWWRSERSRTIVTPAAFWWFSLAGSILTGIYAVTDRNLVFLAGPCVNFFIYARNIGLQRGATALRGRILWTMSCGVVLFAALALSAEIRLEGPASWLAVGIAGQLMWVLRFPIQWIISERLGRSELPTSFFVVSLVGSILLLAYALHTRNPIWIAGMVPGPLLYSRNLMLDRGKKKHPSSARGVCEDSRQ